MCKDYSGMEKEIVNVVGIRNISMLQMINRALVSCLPPKAQGKPNVLSNLFSDIDHCCPPQGREHSAFLSLFKFTFMSYLWPFIPCEVSLRKYGKLYDKCCTGVSHLSVVGPMWCFFRHCIRIYFGNCVYIAVIV